MESFGDLIAADDVLFFVNAAITATGQREFHSDEGAQQLSLDFLHAYMVGNYRDLYAGVLALDINDHNAVLIIRRLLETAAEATAEQRRSEGRLIAGRLALLPPQRVYGLFRHLRRAGVNNRRTRALLRDWLAARPDLAFDAVKYRNGLKQALRHTHLAPGGAELRTFLFAPLSRPHYDTPILEAWRRAHYEQAAVYELPYTVAEGFAARHGIPRSVFLERIAPQLSRLERLRLQQSVQQHGAAAAEAVGTDLSRMPLTRLAGYVLSLPAAERVSRREELTGALRTAAARVAGEHRGSWGRVTAVLDDSFSSYGSGVKRQRPLVVALACHYPRGARRPLQRPVDLRPQRRAAGAPGRSHTAGRTDPRRAGHSPGTSGDRLRRLGQRPSGTGGRGAPRLAHPPRYRPAHQCGPPQPGVRRGGLRRPQAVDECADRGHP